MNCPACGTHLDSRATFCPTCGRTVEDPHIGEVIAGRYQVERRIAIGGFGSIYRAYQLEEDRLVALKIMHPELAADANLVARFRREGEVLIKLRDRHTVATYELGETPRGLPFIAMELLDGEPLLRLFVMQGRMPWPRVFKVARAICRALGEAHALGIIHRDLKPGNIFVTKDGGVKVLDFGIAKILATSDMPNPQELTVMGTAVGTVEYMAPEQLMGGRADNRTDIYTVGVLAYELITGRRPFNAAGLDLLTVQLTETPTPPSALVSVPSVVDEVLLKCLAQDPEHRYRDVHDLSGALAAALALEPATPRARTPSAFPFAPENGTPAYASIPGVQPMTADAPRTRAPSAAPLPAERPVLRPATPIATERFARKPRGGGLLLAVAMILFLGGVGLLAAYWL
jgi:serine/threonine-protein kinase